MCGKCAAPVLSPPLNLNFVWPAVAALSQVEMIAWMEKELKKDSMAVVLVTHDR